MCETFTIGFGENLLWNSIKIYYRFLYDSKNFHKKFTVGFTNKNHDEKYEIIDFLSTNFSFAKITLQTSIIYYTLDCIVKCK